jgi:hypothetical protein
MAKAIAIALHYRYSMTIKYAAVYLKVYTRPRAARHELRDYLRFYHEPRLHPALDDQTPAGVYFVRRLNQCIPLPGAGSLWLPHHSLAQHPS